MGGHTSRVCADLLKLSDETDLDILNRSMEVMVDQFQTELLPVAAQLTARLVRFFYYITPFPPLFLTSNVMRFKSVNHICASQGKQSPKKMH